MIFAHCDNALCAKQQMHKTAFGMAPGSLCLKISQNCLIAPKSILKIGQKFRKRVELKKKIGKYQHSQKMRLFGVIFQPLCVGCLRQSFEEKIVASYIPLKQRESSHFSQKSEQKKGCIFGKFLFFSVKKLLSIPNPL